MRFCSFYMSIMTFIVGKFLLFSIIIETSSGRVLTGLEYKV